nr:paraplegin-like isoform X2 [Procambarus clarkii]XP_045617990.1 paraplegin-like isoform X2 [Procambarus clarkii]XP_045618000.1 paraplegin-like isoform X2 [Procambarus clarkii]XP_045618008.1 paraplegin-like isoform X2 [Procambarus clarkii]XP_045618017.1 paraplegin-like isoform X2 [Procambarus clarkii]XP_045618027.1 paraplegin-like isoform X2 [Procambarus clarkii]XP_045618037.1 paraplegin-like isoform X2 [Procambarus clarkii]
MERISRRVLTSVLGSRVSAGSLLHRMHNFAFCKVQSQRTSIMLAPLRKAVNRRCSHALSTTSSWKNLCREFTAVTKLLERSGMPRSEQMGLLQRSLHTSASQFNQQGSGGASGGRGEPPQSSSGDDNKNNDNDERKGMLAKAALWMLTAYMFIAIISLLFPSSNQPEMARYVSWNEFVHHMLSKGEVEEVIVRPDLDIVTIILQEGAVIKGKKMEQRTFHMNIVDLQHFEERLREAESRAGIRPDQGIPVVYERSGDTAGRLLASIIVVAIIVSLLSRNMNIKGPLSIEGISQMTRAKFTIIDPLMPGSGRGVKFADVAGCKEAKQEVMEFVDFLKNPDKYRTLGAKVPKGALLLGPPGCGKTLLAKAVATEGLVPFLAMNGSEFTEMIGGLGAARVRDLFKEARKRAPCIVYIDELDAIGRQRSSNLSGFDGGSGESEQTLNQLLVEMDGIGSKEGVVLLSSTNRLDILDKALLRPGRFDRHILMDLPNLEERREIFEHHLKSIVLEKPANHYSRRMASLTLGFSGADIANVVNEAALHAARYGKKVVAGLDLEYAVERVVGGTEKRSQALSPEDRVVVAYHESGHALLGWLLEHTDSLLKVTIVPRTNQALGFAQYVPKDQKLYTQEQIFERMCMALGGRVAESLVFNRVTTGAQNDLEKVTKMAYAQVRSFGFSDVIGQVSFPEEEAREVGRRPFSQKLASSIDQEASRLIFAAYKNTETILKANMDKLKLLAEALLQKETLNHTDVEAIIGPPPFDKVPIEPLQFEGEINTWKEAGKES